MSSKVLQQYCESALTILNSQYQATQVLQHNATAGAAREQIIKDFLTNHLPELITVVSGQIVDANNNYSKQQDIVLVLKSMPRLPFASGSDLIFQEGVVATIEIKTTLNNAALSSIGSNIQSVRALLPSIGASSQMGITHSWPHSKVLTAVVTYGGAAIETLVPSLVALDESARPDLVLDLSKGLLVKNHGFLLPIQDDFDYLFVNNPGEGFKFFLTFLTEITGTLSSRGVLWRQYW
ncbi:MAG: DUF6602 domain-containing protein [Betaproteobacteria bacterium]